MESLANHLKRLRRLRKLTQAQLAEKAGLPRATLASMEQPANNPGIEAVHAVALALGITLDELISPAPEDRFYKVQADEVNEFRAGEGRFIARRVSPIASRGVEINHVTLLPGCDVAGRAHPYGAQEFLYGLGGNSELCIQKDVITVEAGALVQFPGHFPHRYMNGSPTVTATAVSIVVFHLD